MDNNLVDNFYGTALMKLVQNKNLKGIKLSLQYGGKINNKNIYNKSTIYIFYWKI
jgi:hypothetical protein